MQRYNDVVIDSRGTIQPTASITVNIHGGGGAVVYSNNTGSVIPQPFLPNAPLINGTNLGGYFFYAADGRYDVVATFNGTSYTTYDVLLQDVAASSGSSIIGYIDPASDAIATNVQEATRALNMDLPFGVIPNNATAANKNCTILGDSISHGYESLNTFLHGWVRIFQRCWNAEVEPTDYAQNYGFVNMLTLGSGGTTTNDIHQVSFGGTAWTGISPALIPTEANNYPAGVAERAGDATSTITITVPSFTRYARIFYGIRPSSVPFTITVAGVLAATVTTAGAASYSYQDVTLTDNGYGSTVILIQSTAGSVQPDIIGISYLNSLTTPVLNNFSESGRRLAYTSQALIQTLMQESSMMIVALGHNDFGSGDFIAGGANDAYYALLQQVCGWITTYAKQYGVRIVVPDFCWYADTSSRTRQLLRKLAADTAGIYIDLPGEIFKNHESLQGWTPANGNITDRPNYYVTTIAMWLDGSHPNKYGHQWIAETIAKRLGLSCCSKYDALYYHDYWMPLALKSATLVYNVNNDYTISSYKLNGSEVLVRLYVRMAASPFPVANGYVLQDSWPVKSAIGGLQGYTGIAVVRLDTNAIVSYISVSVAGQITLNVVSSFIVSQQISFSMPATM
jgi:lysophospholipase L1-like esterase